MQTIFGFGTTYLGRRAERLHHGTCRWCGEVGILSDHETKVWFVAPIPHGHGSIPVLPGYWVQLLDYCSRCDGHDAVDIAAWRRGREPYIAAAVERCRANPDDATAALELLRITDRHRPPEEAMRMAEGLSNRFARDPDTLARLGEWHDAHKRGRLGLLCWERVHSLDPQGTTSAGRAAITSLAVSALVARDFDRAHALSDRLRTREPQDSFHWWRLARLYHHLKADQEAHECLCRALEALPELAPDLRFYELVREVERALGTPGSLVELPPESWQKLRRARLRWHVLAVLSGCLVLSAIPLASVLIARFRRLYLINATPLAARVTIDDETVTVPAGERTCLWIGEGAHRARIEQAGLPAEELAFAIRTGFWSRLGSSPVSVINVRGAGCSCGDVSTIEPRSPPTHPRRTRSCSTRVACSRAGWRST